MLKTSFPASGNMSIEAPELYIKLEKIDVAYPEATKKSPEKNQINIRENRDKEDSVNDVRHSILTEIKQEVVDLDENHSENHIQESDSIPNNFPPIRIKELEEIIDVDTSSDSTSTNDSVSSLDRVCPDSSNSLNPSTRTVINQSLLKQYGRAGEVKIGAILNTSTGNLLIPTQVPIFGLVTGPNGKPTLKKLTDTVTSCDILNIPSNSQKGDTNVAKSSHTAISNEKNVQLNGKTQNVTSRSDTNSHKPIRIKPKKIAPKPPTCSREKPSDFVPSKTPTCSREKPSNVVPSKTPKCSREKPSDFAPSKTPKCSREKPSNIVPSKTPKCSREKPSNFVPSKTPTCSREKPSKVVPSKTPKCSLEKPSDFVPSDGAAFLHSQVRTNPALQSILEDIYTLNQQYYKIDNKSIADELDKLRTKNKLPLITFKDSVAIANDSDSLEEDAGQGSDTDTSNSLRNFDVYGNDEENQVAGSSNGSDNSRTIKVEEEDNDDDCDKLVIDETEVELQDQPECISIGNSKPNTKKKPNIWIMPSMQSTERCLLCGNLFKSVLALKQHFKDCSRRKYLELEKTHNDCISRISQVSSPPVENVQTESPGNTFRITQVVSEAQEISQNQSAEISSDNEISKCTYAYCSFEGTKAELKNHGIIHVTGRFYRICDDCDTDFFSTLSLEEHFKKTGHQQVRPPILCTQCDFGCFEPRLYSKHMSLVHWVKRPKIVEEEPKFNDPDVIVIDDD